MPKLMIIIACFLVASCTYTGSQRQTQEIPRGVPEDVGMSSEGLNKIDELAQQYIEDGRIPGIVVGISKHNKVIYLKAHGILEEKTQAPMPEDAIFIMASSTKPVIGVAAMILVDDGLISLDDPVSKYIPEYANLQVAVPLKSGKARKMASKSNNKAKAKQKATGQSKAKAISKTKAQGKNQKPETTSI